MLMSEKIGRCQQMNMEAMALYPLSTVEETTHLCNPWADFALKQRLYRQYGTHLVGNRTDSTDPRHHLWQLFYGAALQELLEVARRFIDAQCQ